MPRVVRPVGHEDRLSVVDHLDELRTRLMVCGAALVVAFGLCFWQNHLLLNLLNDPLPPVTKTAANHIGGLANASPQSAPENPPTAPPLPPLSLSKRSSRPPR